MYCRGRGNEFLRHIERVRVIAYVVDLSGGATLPRTQLPWASSRRTCALGAAPRTRLPPGGQPGSLNPMSAAEQLVTLQVGPSPAGRVW